MVPKPEAIFVVEELNRERVARTERLRFETKHFSVVKSKAR
jgi:hypothetical protein